MQQNLQNDVGLKTQESLCWALYMAECDGSDWSESTLGTHAIL